MPVLDRVKSAYGHSSADDDHGGEVDPRELFDEFLAAVGVKPKDPETAYEAFCALVEAKSGGGGSVAIMLE